MSVVQNFLAHLNRTEPRVADFPPALLTRTAIAAAQTIPGVAGAVICLSRTLHMRVVVGVSDDHALLAEQLEYTAGSGPGIQARLTGQPATAGAHFARRYTAFHDGLVTHTGFRAVRAVPLSTAEIDDPQSVLLLLYATAEAMDHITGAERAEIMQLAVLIGHTVEFAADELTSRLGSPVDLPAHIRDRLAVETAVEMVADAHHVPPPDALDLLRGFAWARNRLVDDVARDLVSRRLALGALE